MWVDLQLTLKMLIDDDEMVEVTPHSIRLRKVILDSAARKKARDLDFGSQVA